MHPCLQIPANRTLRSSLLISKSPRSPAPIRTPTSVFIPQFCGLWGFPGGSVGKESARKVGDSGSIPGSGKSPMLWAASEKNKQQQQQKNPQNCRSRKLQGANFSLLGLLSLLRIPPHPRFFWRP